MNMHATSHNRAGSVSSGATNPLVYAPRACHAFGLASEQGRTYKIYIILSNMHTLAECPDRATLRRIVLRAFEGWDAPEDHPAGFGILHLARDGTYVLASRWSNANNLRHRAFSVDLSQPDPLPTALSDRWIVACVWELSLIKREVEAWISAVLRRGEAVLTHEMLKDYAAIQYTGDL